jgi:hypothetical protein
MYPAAAFMEHRRSLPNDNIYIEGLNKKATEYRYYKKKERKMNVSFSFLFI